MKIVEVDAIFNNTETAERFAKYYNEVNYDHLNSKQCINVLQNVLKFFGVKSYTINVTEDIGNNMSTSKFTVVSVMAE